MCCCAAGSFSNFFSYIYMKTYLLIALLYTGACSILLAQNPGEMHYTVDMNLRALEDDLLPVQITLHQWRDSVAEFQMPRIIPGTYDVHDYGRFLQDFTALNAAGDTLPVERLDTNRWRISQAASLHQLHYRVADTYDAEEDPGIFEPAGTSHEQDSVYLLDNFGYIGYLKGHKNQPFKLRIHKPAGFYGATALTGQRGDSLDQFPVPDYFTLHDNPLLYARPDTAWYQVGNTEVLVAAFSPNGIVKADSAIGPISKVLDATGKYLGGRLPAEKYAVLLYTSPYQMGMGYGALEHHTSTVLHMPEMDGAAYYDQVQDITAHEFFHIITPLRIHSQYVSNFDFMDPRMSRHIWLYEGVTEYNSHLAQVRDSLYTLGAFLDVLQSKLKRADKYDKDIPLTQASRYTLSFFKDQYLNFYQKGALAAMALDMQLIDWSEGDYRLVHLLQDLGQTFGTDTFFRDDQLFQIMARESGFPQLEGWLARYVGGTEPLPLKSLLGKAGISYQADTLVDEITLGGVDFRFDREHMRLEVSSVANLDAFGRDLGWQKGDELLSLNGEELTLQNIRATIDEYYQQTKPGDKVKIKVMRYAEEDEEGDKEKLKARATLITVPKKHQFRPQDKLSSEQRAFREAWLN